MTHDEREAQRLPKNQAMHLAPGLDPVRLAEATGLDEAAATRARDAVLAALGMPTPGDVVKRYVLDVGRHEWASVYLWAGGRVAIFSSWGTYAHHWSHHGYDSVAHFIAQRDIGRDYLLSKFAPEKVFDREKTVANIRRTIVEQRRDGSLSTERARDEWDLVKELDDQDIDASEWCRRTHFCDAHEDIRYSPKWDAVCCLNEVWPALVAAIRNDLGLDERGESAAKAAEVSR